MQAGLATKCGQFVYPVDLVVIELQALTVARF